VYSSSISYNGDLIVQSLIESESYDFVPINWNSETISHEFNEFTDIFYGAFGPAFGPEFDVSYTTQGTVILIDSNSVVYVSGSIIELVG